MARLGGAIPPGMARRYRIACGEGHAWVDANLGWQGASAPEGFRRAWPGATGLRAEKGPAWGRCQPWLARRVGAGGISPGMARRYRIPCGEGPRLGRCQPWLARRVGVGAIPPGMARRYQIACGEGHAWVDANLGWQGTSAPEGFRRAWPGATGLRAAKGPAWVDANLGWQGASAPEGFRRAWPGATGLRAAKGHAWVDANLGWQGASAPEGFRRAWPGATQPAAKCIHAWRGST